MFFKKIRDFPPLENGKGDISYDAESWFINIPIKETDQIYALKVLPQICSRLILKRLLMKLATEITFVSTINFLKKLINTSWVKLRDTYI